MYMMMHGEGIYIYKNSDWAQNDCITGRVEAGPVQTRFC